ncbi:glycosyltransferase [Candidatus Nomurabacteria bacterium]|uniref:Glycosyltransferase n=1 Tax=candidate division WWE3 bacterium TaxID=2053526 RepID=A0A955E077_UNCKA|nr:glycosyltransferase [candidate division WWE3 bacterium]MCB9824134.1 glycosyltransferase [Candidatus Nomurabacteria bacterium]MCB9828075.1 glycosyltransferase [Candidatus Nomurabacteria bacterium]HXK52629.1 glycosyltransferase [bacterium]
MTKAASLGHKVIFIDPPARFKFLKQMLKNRKWIFSKINSNLTVYSPVNQFNFSPFLFLQNKIHCWLLSRYIKKQGLENMKRVLWVYHFDFPRLWDLDKNLKPDVLIYDVVDAYEFFPEYARKDVTNKGVVKLIQLADRWLKEHIEQHGLGGKEWVRFRENELAKRADLMFASHPLLYKNFAEKTKRIIYTPNAGDFEIYSKKPESLPSELNNVSRPLVGYSGAIDAYKFDSDLFIYLAEQTPEITYYLIGNFYISDSNPAVVKIKSLKNVMCVGSRPFEVTAELTHYFDAYIIPYVINEYTYNGCFPVKVFNSLSTGCPVVVSDLPAYEGLENVLYVAKDKEEFVDKVRQAVLDKDPVKAKTRVAVAENNTWDIKVSKQLKAISDFLSGKDSAR